MRTTTQMLNDVKKTVHEMSTEVKEILQPSNMDEVLMKAKGVIARLRSINNGRLTHAAAQHICALDNDSYHYVKIQNLEDAGECISDNLKKIKSDLEKRIPKELDRALSFLNSNGY